MAQAPDRGDIVWIDFDPQAGREQARRRPALVLSPKAYNRKTSLCVLCPMTSRIKGYPFEVIVSETEPSAVLADQVKSMDWKARRAKRKGRAAPAVLDEVQRQAGGAYPVAIRCAAQEGRRPLSDPPRCEILDVPARPSTVGAAKSQVKPRACAELHAAILAAVRPNTRSLPTSRGGDRGWADHGPHQSSATPIAPVECGFRLTTFDQLCQRIGRDTEDLGGIARCNSSRRVMRSTTTSGHSDRLPSA